MLYTYKKSLLPEYCVQQTYRVVLSNLSIGFSGCYSFYMYIVQCKAYFFVHTLELCACIAQNNVHLTCMSYVQCIG